MTSDDAARAVYDEAIVIDGLNVSHWDSPAVYQSLRAGRVAAINATIAIWEDYGQTMDNIAQWMRRMHTYERLLVQVKKADDIVQARRDGKVGIIFGWQNASPIGNRLERLELFHALGVRIIQVTYNERNLLGNGCYERVDGGLSHFGVDAVEEMNRLGILIDLSHVGERTMLDTIVRSSQPVACTHANALGLVEHVRNKSDEVLRAIADRGGVIGANAFPLFLRGGFHSTLDDFVDAIDDLVDRVGIDHVGIGTDFCQDQPRQFFEWIFMQQGTKSREGGMPLPDPVCHPRDLETPDRLPNLAAALLGRGRSEAEVLKILGGNWLRLFRDVWGSGG